MTFTTMGKKFNMDLKLSFYPIKRKTDLGSSLERANQNLCFCTDLYSSMACAGRNM